VPIKLVRVDDRLIHGQVMAVWLRAVAADHIVVVDDKTAKDEFLAEILALSAPEGAPVEVLGVTDAVPRLAELTTSPAGTFVLVRSPVTALQLRQSGVAFGVLNLGGLGAAPGRHQLYRNISASDDEVAAMRTLESLGTRVEIQIVPDDRVVSFASVDK
jgi:D-glucosaminate-specific PTS system IIB component